MQKKDYNEISSRYITPFIDDNKQLLSAINEHQNHQSSLSAEASFKEGKTLPYSLMNRKFYSRR